jgi:hypothetical protein
MTLKKLNGKNFPFPHDLFPPGPEIFPSSSFDCFLFQLFVSFFLSFVSPEKNSLAVRHLRADFIFIVKQETH